MSNKIKKIIKNNLLGFIIGVLVASTTTVAAAALIASNDVSYNNSSSDSTNVKGALDELYEMSGGSPVPPPNDFSTDSWATIANAAKNNNTSVYSVGDTKCVELTGFSTNASNGCSNGEFAIRIANKSTSNDCSTTGFSQTACGFVLEFAEVITGSITMNSTNTNVGGWPASALRTYVRNDIYNALPSDLKSVISDTTVVSGHGSTSGEANFTSTDKLYLLSPIEIYGTSFANNNNYDSAETLTRQLDYYSSRNVTISNYSNAVKKLNTSASPWWTRTASSESTASFIALVNTADWSRYNAGSTRGISPAFKVG